MSRERTDTIRAALREAGYSSRRVSVRADGNRDVNVTIRDGSIRSSVVAAIVAPLSPPKEYYGDGQPFMADTFDVRYLDEITRPIADAIQRKIVEARGSIATIGPAHALMFASAECDASDRDFGRVYRWPSAAGPTGTYYCAGVRHASERMAVELLNAGAGLGDLAPPVAPDPDAWLDRLDLD